jgi:hypothetical protein
MATPVQKKELPPKKQWFGPFVEDFTFVADQSDNVKYHCMLGKHDFEFLVPRAMLSWEPEKLPAHLRIAVAPCPETVLSYFERVRKNHPDQTFKTSTCSAYTFVDEKQKLRRYAAADNPEVTLVVPREVFSGKQEPETIHIGIGELA